MTCALWCAARESKTCEVTKRLIGSSSASMFRRQSLLQVPKAFLPFLGLSVLSCPVKLSNLVILTCLCQLKRIATRCEAELPRRSGKCKLTIWGHCRKNILHGTPYLQLIIRILQNVGAFSVNLRETVHGIRWRLNFRIRCQNIYQDTWLAPRGGGGYLT